VVGFGQGRLLLVACDDLLKETSHGGRAEGEDVPMVVGSRDRPGGLLLLESGLQLDERID
jgi:hypothetical protein